MLQFPGGGVGKLSVVDERRVIQRDFTLRLLSAWSVRSQPITSFWQDDDQVWWLQNRAKQVFPAILLGDSTVTTWLCLLRFKTMEKRQVFSILIFRDALPLDHYRRLLVQLRTTGIRLGTAPGNALP